MVLQTIYTVSTQYLHTIYTISTHYLYNIYTLSIHYLHNIYTLSTQVLCDDRVSAGAPGPVDGGVAERGQQPAQQDPRPEQLRPPGNCIVTVVCLLPACRYC